jgi:hypothetical protein
MFPLLLFRSFVILASGRRRCIMSGAGRSRCICHAERGRLELLDLRPSRIGYGWRDRKRFLSNRRKWGAHGIKCSAKSEGQQARAQQHEAGCGQGQKSVGDQIVITHDTPALT